MMDDWCKCCFCYYYDNYSGCWNMGCYEMDGYKPSRDKIIEKANDTGMSVADIIALINLEG